MNRFVFCVILVVLQSIRSNKKKAENKLERTRAFLILLKKGKPKDTKKEYVAKQQCGVEEVRWRARQKWLKRIGTR